MRGEVASPDINQADGRSSSQLLPRIRDDAILESSQIRPIGRLKQSAIEIPNLLLESLGLVPAAHCETADGPAAAA